MDRIPIEMPDGTIFQFPSDLATWKGSGAYFSAIAPEAQRGPGESEWLHRIDGRRFAVIKTEGTAQRVTAARYVDQVDAVRWLLLNSKAIPEDLQSIASRITK